MSEHELLRLVSGVHRKFFDLATDEEKQQILKFAKTIQEDNLFLKERKEATVIVLFKRTISSLDPEITSKSAFYKQEITYKINDKYLKNWNLRFSLQRDEEALRGVSGIDESGNSQTPKRKGSWIVIPFLVATPANRDYELSPQPLSKDWGQNTWWNNFVDITFGKKVRIKPSEFISILASGRSIGLMSEDFRYTFV